MKSLIFGIVIMALMISFGTMHAVLMNGYIDELMQHADAVISGIVENNFENAYEEYEKMSEKLNKHDAFFASTIRHAELQDLKRSMLRLDQSLRDNSAENALSECAEAKFLMENMADDSKINIGNIL